MKRFPGPRATLGILATVLIAAQLVPYGRDHTNPPARMVAAWDSPATQELARRACYDCHSNETRWPWYASVAPVSWRVQHHVLEGREKLNFTALDLGTERMSEAAGEAAEAVSKGKMPPWDYQLAHPEARLSNVERTALASGLEAMFPEHREGHEGHD